MKTMVRGLVAHAVTGGGPPATEGPVVLMVHGAGMDCTSWQLQTRYLANRGIRALAVDLPAHGASDGAPLRSIVDLAEWLAEFIESASLDDAGPIVVAGHSMGTFVALQLAAIRPDLVDHLLLFATTDVMAVHPDLLEAAAHNVVKAAAMMADWGHGVTAHLGPNPSPGMWMSGGARALIERSGPGVLAADFEACVAFDDAPSIAASVTCPVTMVIGTADRMTPPRGAVALADAFCTRPDIIRLDGVGHMMMTEAADDIRHICFASTQSRTD